MPTRTSLTVPIRGSTVVVTSIIPIPAFGISSDTMAIATTTTRLALSCRVLYNLTAEIFKDVIVVFIV